MFADFLALPDDAELELLEQQLEDAEQCLIADTRHTLLNSLHAYMVHFWHIVEPAHPFVDNWHLHEMCDVLERCERGEDGYEQIIFNVPPGTTKSLLVSVFFPAWCWARDKKKRFLTASYGQHLTTRDNLHVRNIIMDREHQQLFPIKRDEDQNTKTRYNTDDRGWRIATSVGGVGTGEHPHFIIIDDPLSAMQAESEAELKAANQWADSTLSTRGVAIKAKIILVMQRLKVGDLTGHFLEQGGWLVVRFPMRFEKCTCTDETRCVYHEADPSWPGPDPRDHRTEDGELLMPHRFTEEMVRKMELKLLDEAAGQLQQRPTHAKGGEFERAWFQVVPVTQRPKHGRRARGWDTAGTENAGDYTVGVRLCEEWDYEPDPQFPKRPPRLKPTGRVFIEDVVRGQWAPDMVDKTMLATAQQDGKDVAQREEREGGASGKAVISARAKLLRAFNYKEVTLGANKRVRRKPLRQVAASGNLYLLEGDWNAEFIAELCALPNGKHDDQGDGASCAYNSVLLEPPPTKQRCTW